MIVKHQKQWLSVFSSEKFIIKFFAKFSKALKFDLTMEKQ
jgi:hypothetical protein